MHSIRIPNEHSSHFSVLWETYEASFPASERRLLPAQKAIFSHPSYRLDIWFNEDDKYVGLMDWWEYDGFRYVEHIAVSPDARSGGYGSRIFKSWLKSSQKPVFLEIDPVTDDISRRRLQFYQRLGFVENPMEHVQPHFQGTGEQVRLRVLSYPRPMSGEEYADFLAALKKDVWAEIRGDSGGMTASPAV